MLGRRDLEPASTPTKVARGAPGLLLSNPTPNAQAALRRGDPNTVAQLIVQTHQVSNRQSRGSLHAMTVDIAEVLSPSAGMTFDKRASQVECA
jgi:hypothetical protein